VLLVVEEPFRIACAAKPQTPGPRPNPPPASKTHNEMPAYQLLPCVGRLPHQALHSTI